MAASTPREKSLALVSRIVTALDDKKATDIRIIDVGAQSGVTDFFVVATGMADQHLRGLRMEVERVLDEDAVRIVGIESQPESGWTVIDCFDVIVHIFRAEQRANFQFEKLWKDGKELPAKQFIKGVERVLPEQAVLLTGNSKTPVAAKKSAARKDSAKVAASKKAPVVKASVKAKLSGAAKPAKKQPAKEVEAEVPAKKAIKEKQRPATAAEKKIIAKKEAKAAKVTRAKAKAKAKPSPLAKAPVKTKAPVKAKAPAKAPSKAKSAPSAKAGVITRKAKRA